MERNFNLTCTNCWLCQQICPVYQILKDEIVSPRAKNNIAQKKTKDEVDFDCKFFYDFCNGCEACLAVCPIKVGFDVVKVRQNLIKQGFVLEANKIMVENIKKYKNPFGQVKKSANDGPPDKIYCC